MTDSTPNLPPPSGPELLVFFFAKCIVTLLWALIGFVLWIPFVLRAIAVFSGAVMLATVARDRSISATASQGLMISVTFFAEGFRYIWREEGPLAPAGSVSVVTLLLRLPVHVATAIVFWGPIVWYLYPSDDVVQGTCESGLVAVEPDGPVRDHIVLVDESEARFKLPAVLSPGNYRIWLATTATEPEWAGSTYLFPENCVVDVYCVQPFAGGTCNTTVRSWR